jgi:2-desacetyl-2-hydroxyethyl bacteriochlorophyllide A dehydrogenase
MRLPAGVSFEVAATTEPLATSLHAVNLALRSRKREHFELPEPAIGPADLETAVVFGAGTIGLGILQILKTSTKAKVVMVDLSARRLAVAKQLGADEVINAGEEDPCVKMMDMTGRKDLRYVSEPTAMVDTVFDCVGASRELKGRSPLRQAVTMIKPGGNIVLVAFFEKPLEIEFTDIVAKNISIYGSLEWSKNEFSQAFELICSGKIDRKPLITHEFTLDDVKEAYHTQAATDRAVKVVLKP